MSTKPYLKGLSGVMKADSDWLGAADIPWDRDTLVTIEHAILLGGEKMSGAKLVNGGGLKLIGTGPRGIDLFNRKQWKFGATVLRTLNSLFTNEVSNWIGKEISLYVDPSVPRVGGGKTAGVRVRDPEHEAHRKRANELASGEAPEPAAEDSPPPEEPFSLGNSDVCGKPCGDTNAEDPDSCGLDAGHDGGCEAR